MLNINIWACKSMKLAKGDNANILRPITCCCFIDYCSYNFNSIFLSGNWSRPSGNTVSQSPNRNAFTLSPSFHPSPLTEAQSGQFARQW
jgi:hypothetical protein